MTVAAASVGVGVEARRQRRFPAGHRLCAWGGVRAQGSRRARVRGRGLEAHPTERRLALWAVQGISAAARQEPWSPPLGTAVPGSGGQRNGACDTGPVF